MRTVKDLRNYLQSILEDLEDLPGSAELDLHPNTWGLGQEFLATRDGYLDLRRPAPEEESFDDLPW